MRATDVHEPGNEPEERAVGVRPPVQANPGVGFVHLLSAPHFTAPEDALDMLSLDSAGDAGSYPSHEVMGAGAVGRAALAADPVIGDRTDLVGPTPVSAAHLQGGHPPRTAPQRLVGEGIPDLLRSPGDDRLIDNMDFPSSYLAPFRSRGGGPARSPLASGADHTGRPDRGCCPDRASRPAAAGGNGGPRLETRGAAPRHPGVPSRCRGCARPRVAHVGAGLSAPKRAVPSHEPAQPWLPVSWRDSARAPRGSGSTSRCPAGGLQPRVDRAVPAALGP